ncbi:MAG: hypothetical protein WKF61_04775 [Luteimonas sp.]
MKIKFSSKDPRRGMIAEMDDFRARELIEAGSAVEVSGNKAESAAPENKAEAAAPSNKAVNPITAPARTTQAVTTGTVSRGKTGGK